MVRQTRAVSSRVEPSGNHAYTRTTETVKEYPITSLLCAFSAGAWAGFFLSRLAVEALSRDEPSSAEKVGRKVVDALAGIMPEAILKRVPL